VEGKAPNLILVALALALAGCGNARETGQQSDRSGGGDEIVLSARAGAEGRAQAEQDAFADTPTAPKVKAGDLADDAPSPGAPSDAEVREELREARAALARFRAYLDTTALLPTGPRARVASDGSAVAPEDAPDVVKRVILAGNAIAKFPYKWGGGHGAWRDNGYDCSGSVSFALAAAGLLDRPLTSGLFMRYGDEGPGDWITIYANQGHVFMVVAGLRFDTSGRGRAGTRWQEAPRGVTGFAVRHIPGL
jgi:cell wall-associated NlpC family hydrolase